MTFKITTSKKFKALTKKEGLTKKVRKEFSKRGPVKVKQAIIQDMIKGISPVQGGGKWKKYSDSYKAVIKNTAAFRYINGKIRAWSVDDGVLSSSELTSFRASRQARRDNAANKRANKELIKKLNEKYHDDASPTKSISPVNLRHTGGLHKSLVVRPSKLGGKALIIQFKSKLADIHNRLGAGKSKVIRRLLPTKNGETFNRKINTVLFNELKKAVDKVAKQFSGQ